MSRRVLVTGSSSPVGRAVVSALRSVPGVGVVSGVRIQHQGSQNGSDVVVDLTRPDEFTVALAQAEAGTIVHLATLVPLSLDYESLSVRSTRELVLRSIDSGATRFVFASSAAVYGDSGYSPYTEDMPVAPRSSYAEVKARIEEMLVQETAGTQMSAVSLRIFNVWGPDLTNSLVNRLASAHSRPQVVLSGLDDFVRDYVHVRDVATVFALASDSSTALPAALNVGTGIPVSNRRLIEILGIDAAEIRVEERQSPSYSVADITRLNAAFTFRPRGVDSSQVGRS